MTPGLFALCVLYFLALFALAAGVGYAIGWLVDG